MYVAGQIALSPASMVLIDGWGAGPQSRLALRHCTRVLAAMATDLHRVTLAVCYTVRRGEIRSAMREWEWALKQARKVRGCCFDVVF